MNWDDLKTAVAVFQAGSYFSAAARLGIDETTVSRRISRLERAIGFAVFEAVDGARKPTPRGGELLRRANLMSAEASAITALLDGEPDTETFRVATTDSLAVDLFGPAVPRFLHDNPDISLSFMVSTENVNFSRWEADFAVRLQRPDKGDFLVSKLGDLDFYLIEPATAGGEVFTVGYPDDLGQTPEAVWLKGNRSADAVRCTTKDLLVQRRLIATGTVRGILPGFMCADFRGESRFRLQKLDISRGVWLLMQPHLREQAKARKIADWIKATAKQRLAAAI